MKAIFKRAVPYAKDAMNLPVADLEAAIPFYEKTFNFRLTARNDAPYKSAILARDEIQIGLAENGGDGEIPGTGNDGGPSCGYSWRKQFDPAWQWRATKN